MGYVSGSRTQGNRVNASHSLSWIGNCRAGGAGNGGPALPCWEISEKADQAPDGAARIPRRSRGMRFHTTALEPAAVASKGRSRLPQLVAEMLLCLLYSGGPPITKLLAASP